MNQSQNHSPFQRDPNHPNRHRPCPHLFQRLRAQKKSASNRRKTPTAVVSRCELCGITRSHTDLVHAVVESPSADSLRPRTSTSSKVQTQRERRKTRDESGCLTCRLRKKSCPIDTVDGNKYCEACRNLNIECLGYYGKGYPPSLKDKSRRVECIAKIRGHTKRPVSRRGPELSLNEFRGSDPTAPRIQIHPAVSTEHSQPPDTLIVPRGPAHSPISSTQSSSPCLLSSDDASSVHTSAALFSSGRITTMSSQLPVSLAAAELIYQGFNQPSLVWRGCNAFDPEAGPQLGGTIDPSLLQLENNISWAFS